MVTLEEAPARLLTRILGRPRLGCEGGGNWKAWGGQRQDGGTGIQGKKEREELARRKGDCEVKKTNLRKIIKDIMRKYLVLEG